MSRSYKKSPWFTDGSVKTTSERKRNANKKVRKYKKGLSNGSGYKKISESYDIHDWYYRWSWEEAKKEYETNPWPHWLDKFPTIDDFYQYWKKSHYRK